MDDKDKLNEILTMENARLREDNRYYESELDSFRNGEAQKKINKTHAEELATRDKRNEELERENRELRAALSHNRDMWLEQLEIQEKEFEKKLAREVRAREAAEKSRDAAEAYALKKDKENIALRAEVKELKRQHKVDQKETATWKGRYESLKDKVEKKKKETYRDTNRPSSYFLNGEKVDNPTRPHSGKHVGAQDEHPHWGRKRMVPTERVHIKTPDEFKDESRYRPTGNVVTKQVIGYLLIPQVVEYFADEYIDRETGKPVHAPFPKGVTLDVNYDENIKALAFLLCNKYNLAVNKVSEFFKQFFGGIAPSTGWICQLTKEFSKKSKDEQEKIFADMSDAAVLQADYTFGRMNGMSMPIVICSTKDEILFMMREHRGYEGLKGTPVEKNDNILVCDGEYPLLNANIDNQQCWAHILRRILNCKHHEPHLNWPDELADWAGKSIHYINEVKRGNLTYSLDESDTYADEFEEIVDRGLAEYEKFPPSNGYTKGKKLLEQLKGKGRYIMFLYNLEVPPTNNRCERGARWVKRKLAECRAFRSSLGLERFCECLSIIQSFVMSDKDVYEEVRKIFSRE